MIVRGDRFSVSLVLSPTGRLFAIFDENRGFGILARQDPGAIIDANARIDWGTGSSEFLKTSHLENGKAVELEAVIFKPSGDGPFPLAVVNHGSTGSGDNEAAFADTWSDPWIAEVLNARGWIVAFPQRRGRGKSGGLYDEGFGADRSDGYTCDTQRSLGGADRALQDLSASIDALRKRPDVQAAPVLLIGTSRGGILSITYSGIHPEQVRGVINVVGGWMGEGCGNANTINQTLSRKGGSFAKPTLWLYGKDDYFYSIEHSRKNFAAYEDSGGKGAFIEVTVPGQNNGHWVISVPPLWSNHVVDYLNTLEK
ncbi:MAG: alpha/beta hydrolase family protein [Rhizobiaceae bacterium]